MGDLQFNADGAVKDLDLDAGDAEFVLELGNDKADKQIERVEIAFRTTANLAVASSAARSVSFVTRNATPAKRVDTPHEIAAGDTSEDLVWYPDAPLVIPGEPADHKFVVKISETDGVTARISVFWKRL